MVDYKQRALELRQERLDYEKWKKESLSKQLDDIEEKLQCFTGEYLDGEIFVIRKDDKVDVEYRDSDRQMKHICHCNAFMQRGITVSSKGNSTAIFNIDYLLSTVADRIAHAI